MKSVIVRLATLCGTLALWAPALAQAPEPPPPGSCHNGAYRLADGRSLVITPSEAPDLRYRFLDGASGRLYRTEAGVYESGEGWARRSPVTVRVRFGACGEGAVVFERGGGAPVAGTRVDQPAIPISFASGRETLHGELVLPAGRTPRAVVVVQYGSGRDSAVLNNYVQHLLPLKDVAVFVFDKRGTGRSSGRFTADFDVLADDLVAAAAAVRSRPEARGLPLGLMGESQGGWVAPLAASRTDVDFVVVSYGLAVSIREEDRQEVAQDLRARGYGPEVLARGQALHDAASRVAITRFAEGLEELEDLKAEYRDEPWFAGVSGDYTSLMATTPAERMDEVKALLLALEFDLEYDPAPVLARLDIPMLWVLAAEDTEAPHEATLAVLRELQARGSPIDVAVFPDADHGVIAVEPGPDGKPALAGRLAPGYLDLLGDWIAAQRLTGAYGDARIYPRSGE